MTVRRRNYRRRFATLFGVLILAATITYIKNSNYTESVGAYSLANFDPGFIISDYVMGDYNSMTEQEIQAFLTSKNSCSNTNKEYYDYLSTNSSYKWHWKDDHFVCLSEELFGDGEVIGEGETAAHIIWQAAQDYKINPKVLIVLLEKETSLITDRIPNNGDYRKATGYGCPDTAACSAKYYGFKNQVRSAANLFHVVLTGGWTNFPLGINYVQYNPSADCGGSEVNIRSLATSALYRYTPYQPNQGALDAGYGTAPCGAYGNRNFYLYYGDWFGDPTIETNFVALSNPRYFELKEDGDRINPYTNEVVDTLEKGRIIKFISKIEYDNSWCFRTEHNTIHKIDSCMPIENLKELELVYEDVPEDEQLRMVISDNAKKTYIRGINDHEAVAKNTIRKFTKRTSFQDVIYYITEYDEKKNNSDYGIKEEDLEDLPEYQTIDDDYYIELLDNVERINTYTKEKYDELESGRVLKIKSAVLINDEEYYRTEHNTTNNIDAVFSSTQTKELKYELLKEPEDMSTEEAVKRINPFTGEYYDSIEKGRKLRFMSKIQINDKWYYRTEHNTANNIDAVISEDQLRRD